MSDSPRPKKVMAWNGMAWLLCPTVKKAIECTVSAFLPVTRIDTDDETIRA